MLYNPYPKQQKMKIGLRGKMLKMAFAFRSFADQETPNLQIVLSSIAEQLQELSKAGLTMHQRIDTFAREPFGAYAVRIKSH